MRRIDQSHTPLTLQRKRGRDGRGRDLDAESDAVIIDDVDTTTQEDIETQIDKKAVAQTDLKVMT